MKKIPTMFERDWDGDRSRVLDKPHPDCAWVFAGEGVATRKYDGTSCMIRDGKLYKRREVKKGKPIPSDMEIVDHDEETGKTVGWVPVGDGPEDKWHRLALESSLLPPYPNGTYELMGEGVQGNAENCKTVLWPHDGAQQYPQAPRTFDGLRAWLEGQDIEGLVFHHPDGRMAKIKLRDFGFKRRSQS